MHYDDAQLKDMKIGVIAGGVSSERDISLVSGKAVFEALRGAGYDAAWIVIESKDCLAQLKQENIGIAFIALHGEFGEDGGIQTLLEQAGIPYTGSGPAASKLALDKVASRKGFTRHNLLVPECAVFESARVATVDFDFPVVVKPCSQGSSIGLSIVEDGRHFEAAIREAFRYDTVVIVEKFIEGRELTVGILGEEALPIVEIVPKSKFYDYTAKYTKGLTDYLVPAQLPQEIGLRVQRDARLAHRALDCRGFSRVDIRLSRDNEVFILEVNTIPGLTETSLLPKAAAARGMRFQELCIGILQQALRSDYNALRSR